MEANGIGAFGPIPLRVVGYGGWLTHNQFAIEADLALDDMVDPPAVFAYGYSSGAPTHSVSVSIGKDTAKWSGAMVGASVSTPSGNDRRSNVIQGMTELFLDIPEATLDIRFSKHILMGI